VEYENLSVAVWACANADGWDGEAGGEQEQLRQP
jgi:hypothetical protein